MKGLMVGLAIGLVIGAGGTASASLYSRAKGRFSTSVLNELKWESDCRKPYFGYASSHDSYEAERTKGEYQRYRSCVVDNAKNDVDYASGLIVDAAKAEMDDVERQGRAAGWTFY